MRGVAAATVVSIGKKEGVVLAIAAGSGFTKDI